MRMSNTFKLNEGEFVWIYFLDNHFLENYYDAFTTDNIISDLRIYKPETFLLGEKKTDILIYDTKFYLTLERWNKILGKRYKQ